MQGYFDKVKLLKRMVVCVVFIGSALLVNTYLVDRLLTFNIPFNEYSKPMQYVAAQSGLQISNNEQDYKIAEVEENDVSYYGFINKHGGWYIMRADTATGSFRYVRGKTNFPENWRNRANLVYEYLNNSF